MPTILDLFDHFSANLRLYRKEYRGLFMCPLCLRKFSSDRIGELSKAHIIPKSLGGKEWTLACRSCNNKVGSEIESCEAERIEFGQALSGQGTAVARVQVWLHGDQGETLGPIQADLAAEQRDREFRKKLCGKKLGSNPEAFDVFDNIKWGTPAAEYWTVEVHFSETRSHKRANLTYVHAAYLLMFHQFGYEWALDFCTESIRAQIASPDEPIILPQAPVLHRLPIPNDMSALLLVTHPVEFRRFALVLPLFSVWDERKAVWMPLFGCPYDQPPQAKGVKIEYERVPDHHQVLDQPDSRMQGFRFIDQFFRYTPVLYDGGNWFKKYG